MINHIKGSSMINHIMFPNHNMICMFMHNIHWYTYYIIIHIYLYIHITPDFICIYIYWTLLHQKRNQEPPNHQATLCINVSLLCSTCSAGPNATTALWANLGWGPKGNPKLCPDFSGELWNDLARNWNLLKYIYMYVCMYIYMYVYVYIYIYIHMYVFIYTYIYIFTYIYIHMYVCIYIYMYMWS